ncbi:MAG TPA: hypothetical protein PLH18_03145, partial [Clostridia bacterium]|nr:hypothetical protein [Clostridia bacterium]
VINNAGDEGIVFFNNAMMFYQFAKNGALLNMSGSLDSSSYIDTQGSLYSNVYKLDNQIYGIPIEENLYVSSRLYYSEWLGGEDPKEIDTISELYDYIYKVTYNDLDHNYEDDTPGLTVNIWKINEELPDISKSFGCYFPFNDTKSLSYNPITDSFEDTVFSPNFKEYIMFLKDMSDKKMMVTDAYDKGEILASDNPNINPLIRFRKPVATFWGRLINYANSSEYSVGSVSIKGSNETYLHEIEGYYGFKCYGILAGTDNPTDYLNLINEAFTTDDRYYLALMYGVPDLDYKVYEGNRISYMLDDTSLNIDAPHKGIYSSSVNKIPAYRGNYDQIYSQYEEKITIYKSIVEQLDYRKSYALPFENTFQYLSESGVIDGNMPEYINIIMNPVFNCLWQNNNQPARKLRTLPAGA